MNLFNNTAIRSAYDRDTKTHWFSAVDICSALMQCDYQKGRNYWKWFKHRQELKCRQKVTLTNQLKMQAADGRLRQTDVLDPEGVIRLIMLFPGRKADKFKLWIAELINNGKNAAKSVANALTAAKDKVRNKVLNMLVTTEKRQFNVTDEPNFCDNPDGGFCFFPYKEILMI